MAHRSGPSVACSAWVMQGALPSCQGPNQWRGGRPKCPITASWPHAVLHCSCRGAVHGPKVGSHQPTRGGLREPPGETASPREKRSRQRPSRAVAHASPACFGTRTLAFSRGPSPAEATQLSRDEAGELQRPLLANQAASLTSHMWLPLWEGVADSTGVHTCVHRHTHPV